LIEAHSKTAVTPTMIDQASIGLDEFHSIEIVANRPMTTKMLLGSPAKWPTRIDESLLP
jgi:hypothetical protein